MAKRVLLLTLLPRPLLPRARAVMESPLLPKVRAVTESLPLPRPRSQRVAHRSQIAAHPATTANGQAVVMTFVRMLQRIGVLTPQLIVSPSAPKMVMNYARMLATGNTAANIVRRSMIVIV